jgi:hypothetical protein
VEKLTSGKSVRIFLPASWLSPASYLDHQVDGTIPWATSLLNLFSLGKFLPFAPHQTLFSLIRRSKASLSRSYTLRLVGQTSSPVFGFIIG